MSQPPNNLPPPEYDGPLDPPPKLDAKQMLANIFAMVPPCPISPPNSDLEREPTKEELEWENLMTESLEWPDTTVDGLRSMVEKELIKRVAEKKNSGEGEAAKGIIVFPMKDFGPLKYMKYVSRHHGSYTGSEYFCIGSKVYKVTLTDNDGAGTSTSS